MISKRKKVLIKILIIVSFMLLFFLYLYIEKPHPQSPDLMRMEDIASIRTAMELYYDENNSKYLQSPTTPISVVGYPIPEDPRGEPYGWIDNTASSQKFCVYTRKKKKGTYFMASHCGIGEANQQPTTLDECCELSKSK